MLQPLPETSLAEQAAIQIRDAIRNGRYRPGARLVERSLARELGISHIPVREALARLSEEGLVERLPRRGARVAGLTKIELEELSSLRDVLEQLVAVRVQERLTDAAFDELRGIVDRMVKAARRSDKRRVLALDREFHARLWELADHRMLLEVVNQLRSRLDVLLRDATLRRQPEEMEIHAHAHVELLEALLSGDPERAKQQMSSHVQDAMMRVRALQAETVDSKE
jgi:DNA-binding GntR family transcriptional regulator